MLTLVTDDFPKPVAGTTSFFMVAYLSDTGHQADLLVEAASPDQAVALWRRHFECDDLTPDNVFLVPALTGSPHALETCKQLRLVGGSNYVKFGRELDEAQRDLDMANRELENAQLALLEEPQGSA